MSKFEHRVGPAGSVRIVRFLLVGLLVGSVLSVASSTPSDAARRDRNPATLESISLSVNGVARTTRLALPRGMAPRGGWPLVIQLHGGGGSGANIDGLTGFIALSRPNAFAVASPDGIGSNWNDGRTDAPGANGIDDVAFIDAVISDAATRARIDTSRVYVVGISNGAFMANRYACERADRIAGIGLVAGTMAPAVEASCRAARPITVVDFHGTADPLVPYEGGTVARTRGEATSVDVMVARWAQLNGCTAAPQQTTRADVTTRSWLECAAPVTAHRIEGGGHTWPGGPQYAGVRIVGTTTKSINATREMAKAFGLA
jgi:polyhydroxybutyrate depolymerase